MGDYAQGRIMSIKTVVVAYEPKAKKMAKQIEDTANEMEQKGYEFLTFSITESAKNHPGIPGQSSRCGCTGND